MRAFARMLLCLTLAVTFGLGLAVTPGGAVTSFSPAVNYGVGSSPRNMYGADFNGDGYTDLATANANAQNVSVLLNNGDGTFASATNYGLQDVVTGVFAADLDGDHDVDLVAANPTGPTFLLNNGDGTFGSPIYYGEATGRLSGGDVDNDGDVDIIFNHFTEICILPNNGDATFSAPLRYEVSYPGYPTGADFNGDGYLDLAVEGAEVDKIAVLLNNGDGTFGSPVEYEAGDRPFYLFAADLDGDGDIDIAVPHVFSDDVHIFFNDGSGGFGTKDVYLLYPAGRGSRAIHGADFDGDGDTDLVTGNGWTHNVSVLFNDGTGGFALRVQYQAGGQPRSVFAADFDGDLDADIAVANQTTSNVSILLNELDGDTPEGSDVAVHPVDQTTGTTPVTVTFDNVTESGTTSLTTADSGPTPPAGFRLGSPPTYYDISTTAVFTDSVDICISYDDSGMPSGKEANLKLFHYEDGRWVDVTRSLDTEAKVICGRVGSFSWFVVAYGLTQQELLEALIAQVEDLNLHHGIDNSLDAKLDRAQQALTDLNENNDVSAINALEAFINEVQAQRGNKIPQADADALIAAAQEILELLTGGGAQSAGGGSFAATCILFQNSPNPCSRSTTIRFQVPSYRLPVAGDRQLETGNWQHVSLSIYDISGRVVETLVDRKLRPGVHVVTWETKEAPSGVYFYKLTFRHTNGGQAGDFSATRKMVVLK